MADRARRGGGGDAGKGKQGSKAASALAELRALKASGKKRIDTYEVKEEESVYDVLDDEEYGKLVTKRRQEAGAC